MGDPLWKKKTTTQLSWYSVAAKHTPKPGRYVPLCFPGASEHTGTSIYGWDVGLPSCARCPILVLSVATLSHQV